MVVYQARQRKDCRSGKTLSNLSGIDNMVDSFNYLSLIWGNNMNKRVHRYWGAISCPKVFQQRPIHITLLYKGPSAPHRLLIHGYPGKLARKFRAGSFLVASSEILDLGYRTCLFVSGTILTLSVKTTPSFQIWYFMSMELSLKRNNSFITQKCQCQFNCLMKGEFS